MYFLSAFQFAKIWLSTKGLILLNKSQQEQDSNCKHILYEELHSWNCVAFHNRTVKAVIFEILKFLFGKAKDKQNKYGDSKGAGS